MSSRTAASSCATHASSCATHASASSAPSSSVSEEAVTAATHESLVAMLRQQMLERRITQAQMQTILNVGSASSMSHWLNSAPGPDCKQSDFMRGHIDDSVRQFLIHGVVSQTRISPATADTLANASHEELVRLLKQRSQVLGTQLRRPGSGQIGQMGYLAKMLQIGSSSRMSLCMHFILTVLGEGQHAGGLRLWSTCGWHAPVAGGPTGS